MVVGCVASASACGIFKGRDGWEWRPWILIGGGVDPGYGMAGGFLLLSMLLSLLVVVYLFPDIMNIVVGLGDATFFHIIDKPCQVHRVQPVVLLIH